MCLSNARKNQGPFVQSIVSLTKLLGEDLLSLTILTKLIAVLFLLKNYIFRQKLLEYLHTIFGKFNVSLTNNVVSF